MQVLMLGWEYPPRVTGGLGTATAGIARGLAAAGVEVTLMLPEGAGAEPTAGVTFEPVALEQVPSDGLPAPYARTDDPYAGDLLAVVESYAAAVAARAQRGDFALVHAHDWMTWPAAIAARAVSGRPFVAHVHSIELDRQPNSPNAAVEAVEARDLHAADRVVCVSRYTAERVERRYGVPSDAIRVVHNAVGGDAVEGDAVEGDALDGAPPVRAAGPPVVLFLGRVTRQKGPEAFLRAAAGVAALEPQARFVLAGEGDLLPAMKELAVGLGLGARVEFPGFVSAEERARLFARASVFVLPSVSEPFGIVPLEALAAGVPVVLSRASGVAEVLKSCLTVDAWSIDALIEAILALLRHSALRDQLVEDGQRELEGLRWERRGEELARLFAQLIGEHEIADSQLAP